MVTDEDSQRSSLYSLQIKFSPVLLSHGWYYHNPERFAKPGPDGRAFDFLVWGGPTQWNFLNLSRADNHPP